MYVPCTLLRCLLVSCQVPGGVALAIDELRGLRLLLTLSYFPGSCSRKDELRLLLGSPSLPGLRVTGGTWLMGGR